MKLLHAIAALAILTASAEARIFDSLFAFPMTRRGRATPPSSLSEDLPNPILDSISISKDTSEDDDIIQKLMQSVLQEVGESFQEEPRSSALKEEPFKPEFFQESPIIELQGNGRPVLPRRVEEMKQFGERVLSDSDDYYDSLPQLAARDDVFLDNGAPDVMNLRNGDFLRQADEAPEPTQSGDDSEIRCVPKVMQIEETVYDRAIKCQHSFQEKCHMTYITDYKSSTQEKCETTFKKNCHITFKAMPFNETVNICHTPIVRKCSNDSVGPDICSTHYETNCETRYKTYEVEQDEPVCKMELMKKCQDVTINLPSRRKRQLEVGNNGETVEAPEGTGSNEQEEEDDSQETVTVDQNCEEWPVQKCTLEKKMVKKVHPDTECRKIPRQVCIPNNCQMVQGEEVCRDEDKVQIQNVPQEECELQPEETCHAEAVLVPRLVPKPNCVKVPKEICVNTKSNPRRVKKPVVKQWCYNPKDLKDLKESNIVPDTFNQDQGSRDEETTPRGNFFTRISKLLFSK